MVDLGGEFNYDFLGEGYTIYDGDTNLFPLMAFEVPNAGGEPPPRTDAACILC